MTSNTNNAAPVINNQFNVVLTTTQSRRLRNITLVRTGLFHNAIRIGRRLVRTRTAKRAMRTQAFHDRRARQATELSRVLHTFRVRAKDKAIGTIHVTSERSYNKHVHEDRMHTTVKGTVTHLRVLSHTGLHLRYRNQDRVVHTEHTRDQVDLVAVRTGAQTNGLRVGLQTQGHNHHVNGVAGLQHGTNGFRAANRVLRVLSLPVDKHRRFERIQDINRHRITPLTSSVRRALLNRERRLNRHHIRHNQDRSVASRAKVSLRVRAHNFSGAAHHNRGTIGTQR